MICVYCNQTRNLHFATRCCKRAHSEYHFVRRHTRLGGDAASAREAHAQRWDAVRNRLLPRNGGALHPSDALIDAECTTCGCIKSIADFELRKDVGLYRRQCRKCYDVKAEVRRKSERRRAYERTYLLRQYGMTLEAYEALYQQQNGCCAICGNAFTRRPHVDHDHSTNHVRGLLCVSCNAGIGYLHDSELILEAALRYLRTRRLKAV